MFYKEKFPYGFLIGANIFQWKHFIRGIQFSLKFGAATGENVGMQLKMERLC